MKLQTIIAAAAVALSLAAGSASARDLPAGGLTRAEVAAWLQQHGMKANVHNDSSGESIVSSAVSGVNFDIYFFACSGDRCASIQYAAGWTPLAAGTPTAVNIWNQKNRDARAYLDDHNTLWGEYDVDISPGGTWEQMDQSLARWGSVVASFKATFNGCRPRRITTGEMKPWSAPRT